MEGDGEDGIMTMSATTTRPLSPAQPRPISGTEKGALTGLLESGGAHFSSIQLQQ